MTTPNTVIAKELEFLNQLKQPVIPSGSYFMLGKTDTDVDFFTLHTPNAVKLLVSSGYSTNMDEKYSEDADFISYRKDNFNVILVNSEDELYAIELATYLCTELKVKDKDKRILVFNMFKLREIPDYDENLKEKVHTSISGLGSGVLTVHDEVFDFPSHYTETGNNTLVENPNSGVDWEALYQQYVERAQRAPAPRRDEYRAFFGGMPIVFPPARLPGTVSSTTF